MHLAFPLILVHSVHWFCTAIFPSAGCSIECHPDVRDVGRLLAQKCPLVIGYFVCLSDFSSSSILSQKSCVADGLILHKWQYMATVHFLMHSWHCSDVDVTISPLSQSFLSAQTRAIACSVGIKHSSRVIFKKCPYLTKHGMKIKNYKNCQFYGFIGSKHYQT